MVMRLTVAEWTRVWFALTLLSPRRHSSRSTSSLFLYLSFSLFVCVRVRFWIRCNWFVHYHWISVFFCFIHPKFVHPNKLRSVHMEKRIMGEMILSYWICRIHRMILLAVPPPPFPCLSPVRSISSFDSLSAPSLLFFFFFLFCCTIVVGREWSSWVSANLNSHGACLVGEWYHCSVFDYCKWWSSFVVHYLSCRICTLVATFQSDDICWIFECCCYSLSTRWYCFCWAWILHPWTKRNWCYRWIDVSVDFVLFLRLVRLMDMLTPSKWWSNDKNSHIFWWCLVLIISFLDAGKGTTNHGDVLIGTRSSRDIRIGRTSSTLYLDSPTVHVVQNLNVPNLAVREFYFLFLF